MSLSVITRVVRDVSSMLTSCKELMMPVMEGPPLSIVTVSEMSWPARSLGLVGIGVMREASGTWVVSPEKPVP